jgi:thioredoxin-related protein
MLYKSILLTIIFVLSLNAQTIKEGKFIGSKEFDLPSYATESFLDINEDIQNLANDNKRLLLFFHQNNCPYCARFTNKILNKPEIKKLIQKDFALIEFNIFGDRDVVGLDGNEYSEKEYAIKLGLQFTPVVMFFDEKSNKILQLNGFIKEDKFLSALDYVSTKQENKISFKDFINKDKKQTQIATFDTKDYINTSKKELDRNNKTKELLVFIKTPFCQDCKDIEEKYFIDPIIKNSLVKLDIAQINMLEYNKFISPDGKSSNTQEFLEKLDINLSPTLIFFDSNGKEIIRIDSMLKMFHMQSVFEYVTTKAYKEEKEFQRYLTKRSQNIRSKGIDVDIWK